MTGPCSAPRAAPVTLSARAREASARARPGLVEPAGDALPADRSAAASRDLAARSAVEGSEFGRREDGAGGCVIPGLVRRAAQHPGRRVLARTCRAHGSGH